MVQQPWSGGRHAGPSGSRSQLRALARHATDPSVALLLTSVIAAAAAFGSNVLAARAMSAGGRGEIALMLQVAYLASNVVLLGTQTSVVAVFFGSSLGRATRAYARLVKRPVLAGLALVAVLLCFPFPWLEGWRTALVLVAMFTVANAFVIMLRSISIATRRQTRFLCYVLVSQSLLMASLFWAFAVDVDDSRIWMLCYVLTTSVPTAVLFLRWRRRLATEDSSSVGDVRDEHTRAARREGLALLPAALANAGMMRADRLVLPMLSSTSALGLYATISTMTELLAWPLKAYADTRLGIWRERHQRGELRMTTVVLSALVYVGAVGAAFGLLCYLLVVPLFGGTYASAKPLVLPLVLAAAVYGMSRLTLAGLVARRRNALASVAVGIGFAVSLPAYVLLIPSSGAIGAAYGSLLGYSACLLFGTVTLLTTRKKPAAEHSPPEPAPTGERARA